MTATYVQARDDIFGAVKTAWDPTGFTMLYPDVANYLGIPTTESPWARAAIVHGGGLQSSLSGDTGKRRWTRLGTLTVQLFTPRGEGLSRGYQLAKILGDGLEGRATPRQVWFRNVRLTEVGPDGNFHQLNLLADFQYDEVK